MEASRHTFQPLSEDASHQALRPVGDRYAREVLALDDGTGLDRLALMLGTVLERLSSPERADRAGP